MNSPVYTRLLLLAGIVFLTTLLGCGSGYKTATPTELGTSIFLSIKNNDRDGHFALYVQEGDFDFYYDFMKDAGVSKEQARKEFDHDLRTLQVELDVGYGKMREKAIEDGLDWDHAEYNGVDVQRRGEKEGIKLAIVRVYVTSNGHDFELDAGECARIDGRWTVGKLIQVRRLPKP